MSIQEQMTVIHPEQLEAMIASGVRHFDNAVFTDHGSFPDDCVFGRVAFVAVPLPASSDQVFTFGDRCRFNQSVTIPPNSVIGNHCMFEHSSQIGDSTHIGDYVTSSYLLHCGHSVYIGSHADIRDELVVGDCSVVGSDVTIGGVVTASDHVQFGDRCRFNGAFCGGDRVSVGDECEFNDTFHTSFGPHMQFGRRCKMTKAPCYPLYQETVVEIVTRSSDDDRVVITVDGVGSIGRRATFISTTDGTYVIAGCFFGSYKDLIKRIKKNGHCVAQRRMYIEYGRIIDRLFQKQCGVSAIRYWLRSVIGR